MKTVSRTLIIDDNQADIEWCRLIMEDTSQFSSIMAVTTADEACTLFENFEASCVAHPEWFPPDLIFLDINMPGMDGFEFLERFRAMHEERSGETAMVVMLSSSDSQVDRKRANDVGRVADFITKPLTHELAVRIAEQFGT